MKKGINTKGSTVSMTAGIGTGVVTALGITLLLSLAAAGLISSGTIQQQSVGYCAMVILLLSTVCGCRTAAIRIRGRNALVCMVTGGGYFLSLLAMTGLLFGGRYQAVGVTGLLVLGGSGTAMLLRGKGNAATKRRRIPGLK